MAMTGRWKKREDFVTWELPEMCIRDRYLPDEIRGEKFYELSDMGYEKKLKEHMKFIKEHAD